MPKSQNLETGEIQLVGIIKRQRHAEGFGLLSQQPLMELVEDEQRRLSALEWRLLMYLMAVMGYENVVDAHIGELASAIGHERSAVSMALTKFEAFGLIQREDKCGGRRGGYG